MTIQTTTDRLIGRSCELLNRKNVKESCGIIKFWGTTKFQEGDWVGVELDKPVGKNDGTVDGVKYFSCKPGFGVFVRPEAVNLLSDAIQEGLNFEDSDEKKESDGADFLFTVPVKSFSFHKPTKEWIHLESGTAIFMWNAQEQKIQIELGSSLNHLVCPKAQIPDTVEHQQSWVFRAVNTRSTKQKEVLCVQFASSKCAKDFMEQMRYLTCQFLATQGVEINALRQLENTNNKKTTGTKDRCRMRRRLTVSGSNPYLDGLVRGKDLDILDGDSSKKLRIDTHETLKTSSSVQKHLVQAYAGISRKGIAPYNPDKPNQDSMIMLQLPFNECCHGELLLCVFDGHGENGHLISSTFADQLPRILAEASDFADETKTLTVLQDALKEIETSLIGNIGIDTSLSGTTAVVTVLRGSVCYVANVGDSRIVKGSVQKNCNSPSAVDLSVDHKPDLDHERERIVSLGGRVFSLKYEDGIDGPARVWLSDAEMPGLAMSRSMCDTIGKQAGVVSDAEMFAHQLTSKMDSFIILATDGLWEFMTSQEVVDIVAKHADARDCESALSELIQESSRRWQEEEPVIDDTTIIIVFLQ